MLPILTPKINSWNLYHFFARLRICSLLHESYVSLQSKLMKVWTNELAPDFWIIRATPSLSGPSHLPTTGPTLSSVTDSEVEEHSYNFVVHSHGRPWVFSLEERNYFSLERPEMNECPVLPRAPIHGVWPLLQVQHRQPHKEAESNVLLSICHIGERWFTVSLCHMDMFEIQVYYSLISRSSSLTVREKC